MLTGKQRTTTASTNRGYDNVAQIWNLPQQRREQSDRGRAGAFRRLRGEVPIASVSPARHRTADASPHGWAPPRTMRSATPQTLYCLGERGKKMQGPAAAPRGEESSRTLRGLQPGKAVEVLAAGAERPHT